MSDLSQTALAIFLGLTARFFLFTATDDLLPDAHRRAPGFIVTVAMFIGIVFILVVVRLLG